MEHGQTLGKALSDQRGSAMLAALALSVVMTILGLALFDLGRIENRLVLADKTDAQAFEIAQAGIERAMERLIRTLNLEQAAGLLPQGATGQQLGWADGARESGTTINLCGGSGCTTSGFTVANAAYIAATTSFDGGSYEIAFQPLLVSEAGNTPFSQLCTPDRADLTTAICQDLILVRSTGTIAGVPPGYTSTRTIQALVKASATSGVVDGLTVGSQTRAINGNAQIAGSISVVETPAGATRAWQFSGGSGQQNNWFGLDPIVLSRLRPLPKVCPVGRTCSSDSDRVESLGATLLIRRPLEVRPVDINSGAVNVGASGDSGSYGGGTADNPTRRGKGPLDYIGIADGCAMPCTQTGTYDPTNPDPSAVGSYTGRTDQVFVDGGLLTNPYPTTAPKVFPQLTDPTTVNGTLYAHYACGSGVPGCNSSQAFFNTHAADLTSQFASNIGAGLDPTTSAFTITFTFTTKAGATTTGQICWKRGGASATILEFGSPDCGSPSSAQNPLLIYTSGRVILRGDFTYTGAAIILASPPPADLSTAAVELRNNILTHCPATPCARKFLNDPQSPGTTDMLSILTTGGPPTGTTSAGNIDIDGHDSDQIMGVFYAGVPSSYGGGGTAGAGGMATISKQLSVVGTVASMALTMPNVPRFWQVPGTAIAELNFGSTTPWTIKLVRGFWRICGPGDAANPTTSTFPATSTGVCGYN